MKGVLGKELLGGVKHAGARGGGIPEFNKTKA